MFYKSIRWKMHIWYTVLLVVVAISMLVWVYHEKKESVRDSVDVQLYEIQNRIIKINNEIVVTTIDKQRAALSRAQAANPSTKITAAKKRRIKQAALNKENPPITDLYDFSSLLTEDEQRAGFYFILSNTKNPNVFRSANTPPSSKILLSIIRSRKLKIPINLDTNGSIERVHLTPQNSAVLIGIEQSSIDAMTERFKSKIFTLGLIVIPLAITIGWILSYRIMKPIKRISATASRITQGDRQARIYSDDIEPELKSLAVSLNKSYDVLQQSVRVQAEFTANASHDLRTPIAIISTEAQLAEQLDYDKNDSHKALKKCLKSANYMNDLIEKLMVLSNLDSIDGSLKISTSSLKSEVESAISIVSTKYKAKDITLTTDLDPAEGEFDPVNIRRVILNLLGNAIDHSPQSGEIHISVKCSEGQFTFTITDSGNGIPEELIGDLFNRFVRGDKSRSIDSGHNGLGLSICKTIITLHEGTISAGNTPDKGAEFTFNIPQNPQIK